MDEPKRASDSETTERSEIGTKPLDPDETDDDSLIRWMLSLSPTQRLEVAQGFAASVMALRRGRRA